jgi:hypothetical protein
MKSLERHMMLFEEKDGILTKGFNNALIALIALAL